MDKQIEIIVGSCEKCPFRNEDNRYFDEDWCSLKPSIIVFDYKDKVHEDCPLKNNSFIIKKQK